MNSISLSERSYHMQINRKLSADIPSSRDIQDASGASSARQRFACNARPTREESRIFFRFWFRKETPLVRDKEQCNGTIERGELIVVPILHAKFISVYHIRLTATEYTRQAVITAISFDERTSNESRWRDLGPYSYAHSSRREAKWHDSRP